MFRYYGQFVIIFVACLNRSYNARAKSELFCNDRDTWIQCSQPIYIYSHLFKCKHTVLSSVFFFVEFFFFLQLKSVAIFVYWWVNWNLVLYQNPHNEPISLFSIWILWTTESTQNKNRRINIRRTSFKKLIWILNYFGVYTHTVWHRIYSWTNFTRINQNTAIQNWKYFIFVAV